MKYLILLIVMIMGGCLYNDDVNFTDPEVKGKYCSSDGSVFILDYEPEKNCFDGLCSGNTINGNTWTYNSFEQTLIFYFENTFALYRRC